MPSEPPVERLSVDIDHLEVGIPHAVAELEGCDPVDLPPLSDTINIEAVKEVFQPTIGGEERGGEIAFGYVGYRIVVHAPGEVLIYR